MTLLKQEIYGSEEKYLEQGFADYIRKALSKDQIKAKLDKIFKNAPSISEEKTPTYDPNIDRFKDVEAIVIEKDETKE